MTTSKSLQRALQPNAASNRQMTVDRVSVENLRAATAHMSAGEARDYVSRVLSREAQLFSRSSQAGYFMGDNNVAGRVPHHYEDGSPTVAGANTSFLDSMFARAPELVLAAERDVHVLKSDALMPGYVTQGAQNGIVDVSSDYPYVGSRASLRNAAKVLFGLGTHQMTESLMTIAGTTATASFIANEWVPSLGFVIDVGVNLTSFAPFNLVINSTGWDTLGSKSSGAATAGGNSVDRTQIIVRVASVQGFSIYVPWAHRVSPAMQVAQHIIGVPVDNFEGDPATITITNLPAPIAAAFNASVQLLTAFSPRTAAFLGLQNAFE